MLRWLVYSASPSLLLLAALLYPFGGEEAVCNSSAAAHNALSDAKKAEYRGRLS